LTDNTLRVTNAIPLSCLPDGEYKHSPGVCLSNSHIVAMAEWRTPDWTSGGRRAFAAICCRKYVWRFSDQRMPSMELRVALGSFPLTSMIVGFQTQIHMRAHTGAFRYLEHP
jgi:hypothetical protein